MKPRSRDQNLIHDLENYRHLWQEEAKDHVIVLSDDAELKNAVIFNTRQRTALLIEDEELSLMVIQKMIELDVEIVDKLPK